MGPRTRASIALALAVGAAQVAATADRFTKQDADRFQNKLIRIVQLGNLPKVTSTTGQSTQITDAEVNSYLRYNAKDQIPVGIAEPVLNALGDGRVTGRAVVDLDAVRQQKKRGWLDPLSYITGSMPLTATGVLVTTNGVGRFQLESAQLAGVTIPKSVLQELLSYYSRTAEKPGGINMDDPFELPARIREIRVGRGESTVIQ